MDSRDAIEGPPRKKTRRPRLRWIDYATLVIQSLGLVGLGIYATVTWEIYRENIETVTEMQRQTRIDERPWVKFAAPTGFDLKNGKPSPIVAGRPLQVPIEFRNYGKTAARKIRAGISVEVVPTGQEPVMPGDNETVTMDPNTGPPGSRITAIYPAQMAGTGVIEPGESIDISVSRQKLIANQSVDDAASEEEVTSLSAGRAYVVVWGEFYYADIFGIQHETKFCQAIPAQNTLQKCANYNDVDSEDGTTKR
jgi:hypothetical protein